MDYIGENGIMQFKHEDLIIEFLVNETGKGGNLPISIPQIGINAQSLRYLNILTDNTIKVNVEGINLKLPHPTAYALHKFIIFRRRKEKDKKERDLEGAKRVFIQLLQSEGRKNILKIFKSLHLKWQKTIIKNLKNMGETEIIKVFEKRTSSMT